MDETLERILTSLPFLHPALRTRFVIRRAGDHKEGIAVACGQRRDGEEPPHRGVRRRM